MFLFNIWGGDRIWQVPVTSQTTFLNLMGKSCVENHGRVHLDRSEIKKKKERKQFSMQFPQGALKKSPTWPHKTEIKK